MLSICYFYKYVFHTYICTLQVAAGMSAMLDVFCSRHQCCLNLTWKGLGITLMILAGWVDLVLGSDVTM